MLHLAVLGITVGAEDLLEEARKAARVSLSFGLVWSRLALVEFIARLHLLLREVGRHIFGVLACPGLSLPHLQVWRILMLGRFPGVIGVIVEILHVGVTRRSISQSSQILVLLIIRMLPVPM